VAHTFIPLGPDSTGTWWYEDQTGVASIGYNRISAQLVRASAPTQGSNSGNRVNRVKLGIHTPKTETLSNNSAGLTPPPTVAYIPRCNTEYIMSERASVQDRKDLRKYNQFLQAETQLSTWWRTSRTCSEPVKA